MKFYTTFKAIDTRDGEIKIWRGPTIDAIGLADARFVADVHGWFHLEIVGVILADGEDKTEGYKILN